MDIELLLTFIAVLLVAAVVLLSVLVYRVGKGFRVISNQLDGISLDTAQISDNLTPDSEPDE
jgi:Flp pilus assembly pilin Flp